MLRLNRRFLLKGLAGSTIAVITHRSLHAAQKRRRFTMDLVCGAIGVRANQREAVRLAQQGGFESVQPVPHELANMSPSELSETQDQLRQAELVWGAAGLPVDFRRDEATFQSGLAELPRMAATLRGAGATRVSTWLSPAHDGLTYLANFRQHVKRLRQVAKVLTDYGQRFGLEYVGPKRSWTARRYPFVHTMAETRELIAEIAQDNVGLVLDSWHWYTAGETQDDLLALRNRDIVACDLNDAPAGVAVDQQIDSQRELPAATGVIDLKGFLGALVQIGYDGPVRAEPFNQQLNALDNEAAMAATSQAMRRAFSLVDDV